MKPLYSLLIILFTLGSAHAVEHTPPAAGGELSFSACGYGGGGRFTSIAVDPENPWTALIDSDVAGMIPSQWPDRLGAATAGWVTVVSARSAWR